MNKFLTPQLNKLMNMNQFDTFWPGIQLSKHACTIDSNFFKTDLSMDKNQEVLYIGTVDKDKSTLTCKHLKHNLIFPFISLLRF